MRHCLYSGRIGISILICLWMAAMHGGAFAQTDPATMARVLKNAILKKDSDRICLYYPVQAHCKSFSLDSVYFTDPNTIEVPEIKEVNSHRPLAQAVPFLQLHGNIAYTFDYRSQLDTPFSATNLEQHTEQIYADATLKGHYPFRIILHSRQSNSPYFRNYTDVNIQFNHQAFEQMVKKEMIAGMAKRMQLSDSISKYEGALNKQRNKYLLTKNRLESPARVQEIVQEREQAYGKVLKQQGQGMSKDSIARLLKQPTESEKKMRVEEKELDSLYKLILVTQRRVDSLKTKAGTSVADETNRIRNAGSVEELEEIEKKHGANGMSKTDKTLLAITQLGIGRSFINYSDLTVSNISLTGLNVEFNPSYYAAFAAGTVDYLFRDFVVKPGNMPKQKIVLGRFGWGNKEKRVFIFTAYSGTKNRFGGNVSDTGTLAPAINTIHLFGYSLEGKYKLDRNTDASLEFAKSSTPYSSGSERRGAMDHAFAFSDRQNEAWSAKLNWALPSLGSSINLFYKQVGADFQSYSIYNSGTKQQAWGFKWRQYLFRDHLSVTVQIKKNSFEDPLFPVNYNSSLLFKSFQAVYRKKKWPVFSLGYMPSTQLVKSSGGYLSQNIYYALTAGMFYDYHFLKCPMNSNLLYSQFYNKGTDSGFVFYNAKSILYAHHISLGRWQTQTDVQYTEQPGLRYWTIQQRLDVQIGKSLTIGAGLKNNLVPLTNKAYWGGSGQMDWRIRQLGGVRIQYDKGWLSNGSNGFVPNDWARAVWYKVF